jgi:hypothetical protein
MRSNKNKAKVRKTPFFIWNIQSHSLSKLHGNDNDKGLKAAI